MPTIVERLETNAERFASVTGGHTDVVGGLDELRTHLASHPDEYAVILGPAVDLEAAAALAFFMIGPPAAIISECCGGVGPCHANRKSL